MSLQGKEEARRLLWAALADESYAVGEGRSMKNDYTPLTDAELDDALTVLEGIKDLDKWPVAIRAFYNLREARRLLRAVEEHSDMCSVCDTCDEIALDLGRYLAAAKREEQP